jgi:molecular chaperone DnaK
MGEQVPDPNAYVVGIDLGTTYTAAAIMRGSVVEICPLGTTSAQVPTVVVHRENGEVLTGEAAERRSASEPTRTAREFKRRLGDPVPIIVGGSPYGAEALMAEMLQAIVAQIAEREGKPPATIVLTHPANYTEYKRGLLLEAARLAGLQLDRVRLITEPEAAAIAYGHRQKIEANEIIAVYDFGGGTFDAAVVRSTDNGFELAGAPEGMERLGGIDFDQAVLFHVDAVLDGMVSAADGDDPQVRAGQARLREECRAAKEALSSDTDATIAVSLPGVQTDVRLTREELEQMVRPRIAETVKALERTIASAGLTNDDVSRVLLVGGSSRMPIVGQIVRESIGRPVSTDADPKLAIAIGAAVHAAPTLVPPSVATVVPPTVTTTARHAPASNHRAGVRSRRGIALGVGAACAAVAIVAVVVLSNGDTPGRASPTTPLPALSSLPSSTIASAVPSGSTATTATTGATTGATTATAPPGVTSLPSAATVQRLAFDGTAEGAGIPGPALAAGAPGTLGSVAVGPDGDVYVTSRDASAVVISGGRIRAVDGFAAQDVAAGGITVGSDGSVLITTSEGVVRIRKDVRELVLDAAAAGLSSTLGPLAFDGGGNLYVADNGTARVVRLAPDGALSLVAGTGTAAATASAPAHGAAAVAFDLGVVTGLVVDRDGHLVIADATARQVFAVARDGTIATVAGGGTLALDALDGTTPPRALDLTFGSVDGLALDPDGRLYVADSTDKAIVRFAADGAAVRILGPATAPGPNDFGAIASIARAPTGALVFTDGVALWTLAPTPT